MMTKLDKWKKKLAHLEAVVAEKTEARKVVVMAKINELKELISKAEAKSE